MYPSRAIPLAAPLAAGLYLGGNALGLLLAIIALSVLFLVGRSARLKLRAAAADPRSARHCAHR